MGKTITRVKRITGIFRDTVSPIFYLHVLSAFQIVALKFIIVGGQATANGTSSAVGRLTNSDNLECAPCIPGFRISPIAVSVKKMQ
jgi:hypothetical protein